MFDASDQNELKRKAEALVQKMTLREKAALCSGRGYWHTKAIKRLGLPAAVLSDGPHGLRRQGSFGNIFGVGGSKPATCFPTASALACSFDPELLYEIGVAIAEEATLQDVSLVLGPGVNIKRSPLGGRNFEYFSEDPELSGALGAAFTCGVQSLGVGACVKHFAANSQERNRMVSDSIVDEDVLRETYFPAFEKVIKDGEPAAVMCSYNKVNGTYASENRWLLTDVLRDEWGYEGLVVSDWGATADRVRGLKAGLDLEMPGTGSYNTRRIVRAVKSGELDESLLDAAAVRVTAFVLGATPEKTASCVNGSYVTGNDKNTLASADAGPPAGDNSVAAGEYKCFTASNNSDAAYENRCFTASNNSDATYENRCSTASNNNDAVDENKCSTASDNISAREEDGMSTVAIRNKTTSYKSEMYERHHALARRAAVRSIVLLKNERTLPIAPGAKIAVIGEFAKKPRYQGAGSSFVNPTRLDNAWDELAGNFPDATYSRGYDLKANLSKKAGLLIEEATDAARTADVAIVFAGLPPEYESEGFDRESLFMPPGHDELIRAVCAANENTVVVIQAGAPVDLSSAQGAAAIVYAYLGGQAGGSAIADILTGKTEPSGRLAETFPLHIEDTPCYGNFSIPSGTYSPEHTPEYIPSRTQAGSHVDSREVYYAEGSLVGYKHYEAKGIPVAYPFGYGLKYDGSQVSGSEPQVSALVEEKSHNTAEFSHDRPSSVANKKDDAENSRTKSPEKKYLENSYHTTKELNVPDYIPSGAYPPGNTLQGIPSGAQAGRQASPCHTDASTPEGTNGTPTPDIYSKKATPPYDANSTLSDIRRTPIGFILGALVHFALTLIYGTGAYGRRMVSAIVDETPMRTLASMSGGLLPRELIQFIIRLANIGTEIKPQQKTHDRIET